MSQASLLSNAAAYIEGQQLGLNVVLQKTLAHGPVHLVTCTPGYHDSSNRGDGYVSCCRPEHALAAAGCAAMHYPTIQRSSSTACNCSWLACWVHNMSSGGCKATLQDDDELQC